MTDCDPRFEQASAPDYCDPTEADSVEVRKDLLAQRSEDLLKNLVPSFGCSVVDKSLNGVTDSPKSYGSTDPYGPFNVSIREVSDLCKRDTSPQIITGIILQMLVQHFRDPTNMHNPELSNISWSPDPSENKIRITSSTKWSPEDANYLPAIIVSRGDFRFARMAIGDRDVYDNKKSQDEVYTREVTGSHTITCLGGTPTETELLGFEVVQFLTIFSPILRRTTPIYDFQVDGMSKVDPIEEMSNKLGVRITISHKYPWVWAVQEQAPLLKAITLKV